MELGVRAHLTNLTLEINERNQLVKMRWNQDWTQDLPEEARTPNSITTHKPDSNNCIGQRTCQVKEKQDRFLRNVDQEHIGHHQALMQPWLNNSLLHQD